MDKFLQVTRLLKRRTLAQELCEEGRVKIGDRQVKSSTEVRVGETIVLDFPRRQVKVQVLKIPDRAIRKEEAGEYYIVIDT